MMRVSAGVSTRFLPLLHQQEPPRWRLGRTSEPHRERLPSGRAPVPRGCTARWSSPGCGQRAVARRQPGCPPPPRGWGLYGEGHATHGTSLWWTWRRVIPPH